MDDALRRETLKKSISDATEALAALEVRRREIESLLRAQEGELASREAASKVAPATAALTTIGPSRSTSEKIALFRQLFRGRDDVYPKLWVNSKTGKRGYAPACANEWVRGVCEKPRVRCGECPHQAFLPVGDRIILEHLRGDHVIGVYPLLADETTWFLAADFDKASWVEDLAALRETCRGLGLHPAVERSRSGNGAHIWFFFSAPVAAVIARRMGCFLITETMSRRHRLSMHSYDRLFPNQDTMPRGGFGNLIALPFQDGPRQNGNTVFLDEQMIPFSDQWAYLASLPRMTPRDVEDIATEAQQKGLVVGVRSARQDDESDVAPWNRLPSRRPTRPQISQPLPDAIRSVLAQRLFVGKEGVPSPLLNQINRLAAFQNPEFFKRQNLRLSTALTPRVISCAEEIEEYVVLPRGCVDDLRGLLLDYGVELVVEDKREMGQLLGATFQGTLTVSQRRAARDLLAHDTGVLVAPPGSGKTVVGISLIARRARNTLVLVHRRPLLEQWVAQLAIFLGILPAEIGRIGAGRNKPTGKIDVAMLQSLVRGDQVDDLVAGYGHVVVDECHHIPAVSFERVMREVKARFVIGLTATPHRRDGHHPILEMQIGPIRHVVDSRDRAAPQFSRQLVVRETSYCLLESRGAPTIQDIYRSLVEDPSRNSMIVDDIIGAVANGRSPIVLTERRDHLELLATEISKAVKNIVILQGGMSEKSRHSAARQLEEIPRDEERVILATGRFAGEGFDDSRLDTLFLTLPVSWKGTLIQYAGRLHRHLPEKIEVQIYDYVDTGVPMLARMFEKRARGYRAMGYEVREGRAGVLYRGRLT